MGRHSEIPSNYEWRGETKETKYRGKKDYSPKQIADRIGNPKESPEDYKNRAEYHRLRAESYSDSNNLVKYREHNKKAKVYDLLAEKTGEEPTLEDTANALEKIAKEFRIDMKKHRKVISVISISGILSGLFFLSPNVTGNAIADMTTKTTSFLGAGLLIVGLVAGFFWLKGRKK